VKQPRKESAKRVAASELLAARLEHLDLVWEPSAAAFAATQLGALLLQHAGCSAEAIAEVCSGLEALCREALRRALESQHRDVTHVRSLGQRLNMVMRDISWEHATLGTTAIAAATGCAIVAPRRRYRLPARRRSCCSTRAASGASRSSSLARTRPACACPWG
jgi:hypothetical protein